MAKRRHRFITPPPIKKCHFTNTDALLHELAHIKEQRLVANQPLNQTH